MDHALSSFMSDDSKAHSPSSTSTSPRSRLFALAAVLVLAAARPNGCRGQLTQDDEYTMAYVNVSYIDPITKLPTSVTDEVGKYSRGRVDDAAGLLVHVHTRNGTSFYGCELPFENVPTSRRTVGGQSKSAPEQPNEPWIALIRRGECPFEKKIANAVVSNATAVVVYDDRVGPTQKMRQRVLDIVAIFIPKEKGEALGTLTDNGTRVWMQITVGSHQEVRYTNINRTSVLFVSVSFIILMIISLAWLIFYYVQRFRFINAKDQLAKRLCSAAKKALTKIPVKTLKESDVGNSECCAVCIEAYKVSEVVRILPCKHQFHKYCVDPWLLEQRTCPMCKMDILKYYGLVFTGSQESILQIEIEDNMVGDGGGGSSALDSALSPMSQPSPSTQPPPFVAGSSSSSSSTGDRSRLVVSLPPVGFEVISVPYRPEVDISTAMGASAATGKHVKCQCRCMEQPNNTKENDDNDDDDEDDETVMAFEGNGGERPMTDRR